MNTRRKVCYASCVGLFVGLSTFLSAMESARYKRPHDEEVAVSSKKAKNSVVSQRDVPSLKALVAAYVARKHTDEQAFEVFSQRNSGDESPLTDLSRYDSAIVHLPEELAQYVHSMGQCLEHTQPLLYAARTGNLEAMRIILAKYRTLEDYAAALRAKDDDALCYAAGHGQGAVVAFLLERGANVNAQNGQALWMAAAHRHRDIVVQLLNHGADVHSCGERALQMVVRRPSDLSLARVLRGQGADITHDCVVEKIALEGSAEAAQLLFEEVRFRGKKLVDFLNVKYQQMDACWCRVEKTPLKIASDANNQPVVQAMIEGIMAEVAVQDVPAVLARLLNDKAE